MAFLSLAASVALAESTGVDAFNEIKADQKTIQARIAELEFENDVVSGRQTINSNFSDAQRARWMKRLCQSKNKADTVAAKYAANLQIPTCPESSGAAYMEAEFQRPQAQIQADIHTLVVAKSILQFRELYAQAKATNMAPKVLERFLKNRLNRNDWPPEISGIVAKYQSLFDDSDTEACVACQNAAKDPLGQLQKLNAELSQSLQGQQ
jgi:hypothetical protein